MAPSVVYLSYVIDAEELHRLPDKVQAVQQAPTPRSVTELKSYLGLLTYNVLAHKMPDGSEKPVGYDSCMLNSAERNYSQLEKEGLSCVFGVKHF